MMENLEQQEAVKTPEGEAMNEELEGKMGGIKENLFKLLGAVLSPGDTLVVMGAVTTMMGLGGAAIASFLGSPIEPGLITAAIAAGGTIGARIGMAGTKN